MPSKSIERIPSTYEALRERAVAAEMAKIPSRILKRAFAASTWFASITALIAAASPFAALWLLGNGHEAAVVWIHGHLAAIVLAYIGAWAAAIGFGAHRLALRERETRAQSIRSAPAEAIRDLLKREIDTAEQEAVGPEAPAVVLRTRLRDRLQKALSTCLQIQERAKQRNGEARDELKRHQYRLVALGHRLEAEIERLDGIVATGTAFFAECRARADAFGQHLDERQADLPLLREAERIEGEVEQDLASVDRVADETVAHIAEDLADLRIRFVDELADPSRTLFVRDGDAALEEDLAAYEALAIAAHRTAAK